jgi:starvation-inducible DNA-binding protein
MSDVTTSSYLPPLALPHERQGLGRELEAVLHELVALSLIGKQLHWAVIGPMFRPVHQQVDELVDSWRELADQVAERAVALGYIPNGQPSAVAAGSQLAPVPHASVEDHVVVRELARRIADVSERVRQRMEKIGDVDLVSQDILVGVVRELEKQQWMLRAQLDRRVG